MAKAESWLQRNIVAIVSTTIAATIATLGVAVNWYNGNKPTPPAPQAAMTATASGDSTAVNAASGATVQLGSSAPKPAASQPPSSTPATSATSAAATPTATPGAMHASASTGGTAVNATGSAQVTVQKAPPASQP